MGKNSVWGITGRHRPMIWDRTVRVEDDPCHPTLATRQRDKGRRYFPAPSSAMVDVIESGDMMHVRLIWGNHLTLVNSVVAGDVIESGYVVQVTSLALLRVVG